MQPGVESVEDVKAPVVEIAEPEKPQTVPEVKETVKDIPEPVEKVPEEEIGLIYMLIPGIIRIDNVKHNFDAKRLMKEYGLKKENCIEKLTAKAQGLDLSKLIPLRARPEGDYKEFLAIVRAKRK